METNFSPKVYSGNVQHKYVSFWKCPSLAGGRGYTSTQALLDELSSIKGGGKEIGPHRHLLVHKEAITAFRGRLLIVSGSSSSALWSAEKLLAMLRVQLHTDRWDARGRSGMEATHFLWPFDPQQSTGENRLTQYDRYFHGLQRSCSTSIPKTSHDKFMGCPRVATCTAANTADIDWQMTENKWRK